MKTKHTRILQAYSMAAPFALVAKYENLAQCFEAAVAGAIALTRHGVQAKPFPCAIFGMAEERGVAVGLTKAELHRLHATGESFEDWSSRQASEGGSLPDDDKMAAHVIIDARFGDERVLLDPTFGQLRQIHGLQVPVMYAFNIQEGLPALEGPGWNLEYLPSERAEEIVRYSEPFAKTGMVGDIDDLMKLALKLDCDQTRFHRELHRQLPDVFAVAAHRLSSFQR